MRGYPMAPDWQVSQWFNTRSPLSLGQLRGRVVLLHAFQMLCPGCVSHGVPQAERVHREYAVHGVAVIGLHTVFEHHAAMMPVTLEAFLHEYRQVDIEAYEESCLQVSTTQVAVAHVQSN